MDCNFNDFDTIDPARRATCHKGPRQTVRLSQIYRPHGLVALLLTCTLLSSPSTEAQSSNAYGSANCEASFLNLCPSQETSAVSDSGAVAAPLPVIGAALWEILAILSGVGGFWVASRSRKG